MSLLLFLFFLPLLIVSGVLFYIFAVASRNSYICRECGEKFEKMEYMNAAQCNMCGASLTIQPTAIDE